MLGSSVKSVQPEEQDMKSVSRKSLHASRDIEVGELLSHQDFYLTRPGTGLHYDYLECLTGSTLEKHLKRRNNHIRLIMKNIVLVGAGGHCRSILSVLKMQKSFNVLAIYDHSPRPRERIDGIEVQGSNIL